MKTQSNEPHSILGWDEASHDRYRKILIHAFSDKSLREQAPLIESYVDLLIARLKVRTEVPVDFVEWFQYITFDVGGDLCFGESFGCLENEEMHPWVDISNSFGRGLGMVASINHYPFFRKLFKYVVPAKTRERMLSHRAMTSEKVRSRQKLRSERPDYISTIQAQNEAKTDNAMTQLEIELNMSIMIFAAAETTSTILSGTLRMLVQNVEVLKKAATAVRSSFESEKDITMASASQLEYLNACVNEGLRMCTSNPIGVPRQVPKGGDTICDQWIPGGV